MESLFAQLFLAIQEHIKANLTKEEVAWIDQDLGQLEAYEERPAVLFPCVLIDFPTANYSNEGQLMQWADVNISIRLGFAPFASANSVAPDISKEHALQYYEIEHKLVKALQGFTANDCIQPMIRLSAATERREDTYRVREILFTTGTEDDVALIENNNHTATLDATTEII